MKLRDRTLLTRYIEDREFSQARVGRHAGVSRQFVHMLVTGGKDTCTPEVGRLIEECLGVLPGTLFVPNESPSGRGAVSQRTTRVVRATGRVATGQPTPRQVVSA